MPILKTKRQIGRTPAGTVRKFTAYETRALIALGHAELYKPPQPAATPAADHAAAPMRARREYKRRDMQAEMPATVTVTYVTKDDA